MCNIKITYYGLIRQIVDVQEEKSCIPDGGTVRELLQLLVHKYGEGFRSIILSLDGQLLPVAMLHLNGRDINEMDGLQTKLEANSDLSITVLAHAISGG